MQTILFGPYSIVYGVLTVLLLCGLAAVLLRLRPGVRRSIDAELGVATFVPQLEGLRGLLAVLVVVHHGVLRFISYPATGIWQSPPSLFYAKLGTAPVQMFFFLTGYLFWSKLLRRPHLELGSYFLARLRRLVPVYLVAMAVMFLLVAIATHFERRVGFGELTWSAMSWTLFSVPGQPDVNGLTETGNLIARTPWTLAYEWRFYLLLPLLVWFARKTHRLLYLLVIFGVLFKLSERDLQLFTLGGPLGQVWDFVVTCLQPQGFFAHLLLSFGVGMCVAAIRYRWPKLPVRLDSRLVGATCLLLAGVELSFETEGYFSYRSSFLLGLVFLCVVYGNTMGGVLRSRLMLLLGRCSYSLYLTHGLVLTVVSWCFLRGAVPSTLHSWVLIVVGGCAATVMALAMHEWVEAPFMTKKQRHVEPEMPNLNLPAEEGSLAG